MDSSHLNRPQRMVFRFIEESEDETLEAYSYGNGRFTCGTPNADDHVCFTTHKTGTSLEILIEDSQLIAWLNDTVPGTYCFENEQLYMNTSMDLLLPCYSSLKERFTYDRTAKQSFEALELFIQHFLEEGSVFGIFGFEYLYECDILTEQHFYDIQCQHRSMVEDLEDLDQLIYQVDVPDPADVENESLSPDSIIPELRNAVQKREIGAVASVLTKYRRTVNAKMLCFAIWFYEPSVFRLLLNHGAQVEGSDVMADPLHRAAKAGNMDAVTLLLGYGAEIEGGKFSESVTPLTGASSGGHLHLVKYLIDKGARVDGNVYKTPLSRAIKRGHIEVVKYLLACGADLTAAVPRSMRFEGATRVAHDLEEVLSSHISEMKSGDREVLLSRAVTEGNLDYVGILCACGCYVEPGEYTRSFQTTAEMGSIDLVRDLLDQSSSISPTSPLHIAVAKGNLDLFHFLVGHGVSVQLSRQLDFNWPSQWDFTSPSQCHTPPAAPFRKVRPSRFIERRKLYFVFLNPYPMDKMILNSLLAQAKTYHAMPKGYPLTQTSNLESCPAVAAIRTQERRRIGRKLLTKVSKSLEKLVVAGRDQTASAELMALTEQIDTSLITWRKGTRAIRDIIDGYLPSDISDIISSLQVANAMRSAVPPSQLAYSKQEFMSDLFRWASLVKFEDRPLFAEVISCLWGKTTSEAMWVDAEHFPRLEALLSLQSLVSNLMSESGSFEIGDTSSSTSYRLRSLRQRFLSGPSSTYKPDGRARLSEWHPIDQQEGEEIIYTQEKQPPDPDDHLLVMGRITVLMAGAIFGAIIFFLCWTRPNFDMRFPSTSASVTWEDWASNRILSQNCIILAMYLGPSSLQETGGLYKTDDLSYEVDETFLGGQGCHPIVNDLEHLEASWLSEESDHQIANYESIFEGDISMNDTSTDCSPKSSTCLTTPLPTAARSSSVFLDTPDPVTAPPKQADTVHCPQCQKPFSLGKNGRRGQTSNLGKHMRLYHPEDVPNHTRVVYKCKHGCPYEDPVKSNVKAHENRHCSKRNGTKPRRNGKWRQGT